ncbi:F0F1 ATP synthase subunit delta [Photobacterium sp. GB-27]|uniref:F0F1 ATP synthase subunit delta n=1 Tax=unclassified Photobacterium TaxID=2628852 RepID=UPI000D16FF78|nr:MULTISPECIES: F0F1 ATP synthase subunit delta [unclassified Photobacterium]MCG3865156.1 F0F1 ATP synthase subunit delta [Photobacterium sp. Ph6]MCG3876564.1 F0F1 ATP synthase subunit delta [Photobacterium sp. Ph5]PSV31490.1 F0F1 ATP synthase subunit delta [Photobacterium sp. GB-72]PSV34827.1 F0F1 ATP synthase subunit delta [Photobacterium sp. GB-27]PSV36775.1 F0F1 ATP synthase subunit delta [Photobacterium sp. GB-210]
MSDPLTIAQPYAKAAFDFALANDALEQWEQMLIIAATVASQPVIAQQIEDSEQFGEHDSSAFTDMFLGVCEGLLDEHGQNLIRVMAENGRLNVIAQVAELFHELKEDHERMVTATVTTTEPLTDEQKANLIQALQKKLNRSVELDCHIDESLVGGMLIKAGEMVIDGSLKSSINRLATSLQA